MTGASVSDTTPSRSESGTHKGRQKSVYRREYYLRFPLSNDPAEGRVDHWFEDHFVNRRRSVTVDQGVGTGTHLQTHGPSQEESVSSEYWETNKCSDRKVRLLRTVLNARGVKEKDEERRKENKVSRIPITLIPSSRDLCTQSFRYY